MGAPICTGSRRYPHWRIHMQFRGFHLGWRVYRCPRCRKERHVL